MRRFHCGAVFAAAVGAALCVALPHTDAADLPEPPPHWTHWVVVTSINAPTPALVALDRRPGWRMVVVGDLKSVWNDATAAAWGRLANTTFLTVQQQREWASSRELLLHDLLPFNHYARKNLGYLFAVAHGARVVYDTDDDNVLQEEADDWLMPAAVPAADATFLWPVQRDVPVVNPFRYFGRDDVWPRGYPLHLLHPQAQAQRAEAAPAGMRHVRPWVQQLLAAGDPDTDAIFRLTRPTDVGNVWFDTDKPGVVLPPGVMAPVNSQATLFHHQALWGAVIPVGVPFRVCDIWRGYWLQRLLWHLGGVVAVVPAHVLHDRNAHDYMADFEDELQLYLRSGDVVSSLVAGWRASGSTVDVAADGDAASTRSFFDRVMDVTRDMHDAGFWPEEQVRVMEAWLHDLLLLGYSIDTADTAGGTVKARDDQ